MIFAQNTFFRFLDKLPKASAKGWILQLHLNRIQPPITEEKKALLQSLLAQAEREKRCQTFNNHDSNSVFIFFPENHQDDITALLIKIQFNLSTPFENKSKEVYSLYSIARDLEKLKEIAQETAPKPLLRESSSSSILPPKSEPLKPVLSNETFTMPFTPTLLAQLEKSLQQADLSNLMRRQAICALVGNAKPIELFEEIYIALTDLKKALCPTVNIYESPWLLNRLLETLDKRVLETMVHHDAGAFRKNFSLNIAVKTILSPDFQAFNESIESSARQSILLEIKQADIFSNLSAFLAARSFIKELGYRICVDTVTADSLPLIMRDKLEADFIKLIWTPALLEQSKNPEFQKALAENDPSRIILCRIDDKRAIEMGQKIGLSLFQGYYVQKLLYQAPKKVLK